jgi:hypothetical protein
MIHEHTYIHATAYQQHAKELVHLFHQDVAVRQSAIALSSEDFSFRTFRLHT